MTTDTTHVDSGWPPVDSTTKADSSCEIDVTVDMLDVQDSSLKIRKFYGDDLHEFDDITAVFEFTRQDFIEQALESARYQNCPSDATIAWIELADKASK